MGFPSTDRPLPAAAQSPQHGVLAPTLGSIIGFCSFAAILIGKRLQLCSVLKARARMPSASQQTSRPVMQTVLKSRQHPGCKQDGRKWRLLFCMRLDDRKASAFPQCVQASRTGCTRGASCSCTTTPKPAWCLKGFPRRRLGAPYPPMTQANRPQLHCECTACLLHIGARLCPLCSTLSFCHNPAPGSFPVY